MSINKISSIYITRIIIFLLITLLSINFLYCFTSIAGFDKKEILGLLLSTISIIVAIIVTYLFSKLFAEKTERIQRKSEIDSLSHKITALRKIAFHIRDFYEFWKIRDNDVKSKMDSKYKNLNYEDLRSDKLSYDELTKITKDVGELSIQAYLGLKGLENNEKIINFFKKFNPVNYSLDEIERFDDYISSFLYFLENSSDKFVNFKKENRYSLNFIDELYFEILGKKIDKENYKKEIKELFNYFQEEIIPKHFYLTKLNAESTPKVIIYGLLNMLVFIILLISSLIVFISDFDILYNYIYTIVIVSIFIANTIDLVILTISLIINELKIDEFYRI